MTEYLDPTYGVQSGTVPTAPFLNIPRVSVQFDKTTATLANVTGLAISVSAAGIYYFQTDLFVDASLVGGSKYAIDGSCTANSIIYQIDLVDNSTNATTITSRQTSLGGNSGQAGTTAGFCQIDGFINVNAAGTLRVQFAQNTANGTSSILVGSTFKVIKIP